ncbi:DUF7504 family protein [Halorubrum aethiopicum]|uniref:DUF7504 family protein n=1 Tax=Halorubrum aethiopicum TaxID=1758255 RepID=UPI000834BD07|nr:hypothetical protein [Halorubrum aethiopicum]
MTDSDRTLNDYIGRSTSVLLLAPLHEPPDDDACIDLLTRDPPEDTNVVSVTLSASPAERLSVWQREAGGELPTRATIIDGRREMRSDGLPVSESGSIAVRGLPEDADLYDVGLAIASQLGAWEDADETTVLCLHSVTRLLAAHDTDQVIGLLTALNDLCERLGVSAHSHVDPDAHDEETLSTLRPLYDTVVEYTPTDGWIPTEREEQTPTPSFRSTTTPPGGAARTDPDRPETVPMRHSFETILDLLSCPRRRTLLYHLKNQPNQVVPLDRLVEAVHDIDRSLPTRDSSPPEAIREELLETHLPMLEEAGIARYDADAGTVHYTENRGLESFLRYVETIELG